MPYNKSDRGRDGTGGEGELWEEEGGMEGDRKGEGRLLLILFLWRTLTTNIGAVLLLVNTACIMLFGKNCFLNFIQISFASCKHHSCVPF